MGIDFREAWLETENLGRFWIEEGNRGRRRGFHMEKGVAILLFLYLSGGSTNPEQF